MHVPRPIPILLAGAVWVAGRAERPASAELIVVVDTSGSMAAGGLVAARQALHALTDAAPGRRWELVLSGPGAPVTRLPMGSHTDDEVDAALRSAFAVGAADWARTLATLSRRDVPLLVLTDDPVAVPRPLGVALRVHDLRAPSPHQP